MISVGILHECVLKLLQDAKEESLENNLEYFCQLLTPVGKDLEVRKNKDNSFSTISLAITTVLLN